MEHVSLRGFGYLRRRLDLDQHLTLATPDVLYLPEGRAELITAR